jgi:hypothetical protein
LAAATAGAGTTATAGSTAALVTALLRDGETGHDRQGGNRKDEEALHRGSNRE